MRQDESQKDQLDNEPKILLIHKKGGKEPPILLFSDGEVDMIGVHDQRQHKLVVEEHCDCKIDGD